MAGDLRQDWRSVVTSHSQRFSRVRTVAPTIPVRVNPAHVELSDADKAAQVYRVTLRHESGSSQGELVLALDDDQAIDFGRVRFLSFGIQADWQLDVDPMSWAGDELRQQIRTFETAEECQRRQSVHAGRAA